MYWSGVKHRGKDCTNGPLPPYRDPPCSTARAGISAATGHPQGHHRQGQGWRLAWLTWFSRSTELPVRDVLQRNSRWQWHCLTHMQTESDVQANRFISLWNSSDSWGCSTSSPCTVRCIIYGRSWSISEVFSPWIAGVGGKHRWQASVSLSVRVNKQWGHGVTEKMVYHPDTDTCKLIRELRETGRKKEGYVASIFIGPF